jgi:mono/diheme cytochrome c family protein
MRLPRLLALLPLFWACTPAAQELPGDPAAGGKLAREVCATCHIVSDDQLVDPDVGAPTFFEVVDDPSVSELSLRAFLQTSHATMPNLILTPEETDDIIAYILTLRGVQPWGGRAGPRAQAPLRAVRPVPFAPNDRHDRSDGGEGG